MILNVYSRFHLQIVQWIGRMKNITVVTVLGRNINFLSYHDSIKEKERKKEGYSADFLVTLC